MNRVACVTGAAQGIGLAVARALAGSGFRVLAVDLRPAGEGAGLTGGLAGEGHRYLAADISSAAGRQEILRLLREELGRLDLLVNNAGVAPRERRDILETSEESFDRVLNINLRATFFLTQAAARFMVELAAGGTGAGKIVNISSMSAYTSSVNRPEYCLSKAGVSMLTRLFADRLAEYGINVYEIRPGIIRTPMTEGVQARYDDLINNRGLLPIRRWGEPEDVAAAVRAIAQDAFPYSTGQVFDVDGGFHLRRL